MVHGGVHRKGTPRFVSFLNFSKSKPLGAVSLVELRKVYQIPDEKCQIPTRNQIPDEMSVALVSGNVSFAQSSVLSLFKASFAQACSKRSFKKHCSKCLFLLLKTSLFLFSAQPYAN